MNKHYFIAMTAFIAMTVAAYRLRVDKFRAI